ncbi:hypothetical protein J6590_020329 [Homalodisca vitripennis]|nr:hypothetical protein J6590_020329 [Homalodisca vitripennis]
MRGEKPRSEGASSSVSASGGVPGMQMVVTLEYVRRQDVHGVRDARIVTAVSAVINTGRLSRLDLHNRRGKVPAHLRVYGAAMDSSELCDSRSPTLSKSGVEIHQKSGSGSGNSRVTKFPR